MDCNLAHPVEVAIVQSRPTGGIAVAGLLYDCAGSHDGNKHIDGVNHGNCYLPWLAELVDSRSF